MNTSMLNITILPTSTEQGTLEQNSLLTPEVNEGLNRFSPKEGSYFDPDKRSIKRTHKLSDYLARSVWNFSNVVMLTLTTGFGGAFIWELKKALEKKHCTTGLISTGLIASFLAFITKLGWQEQAFINGNILKGLQILGPDVTIEEWQKYQNWSYGDDLLKWKERKKMYEEKHLQQSSVQT